MFTVAIVGVHGVGKTATAAVLEELGYRYVKVEAIDFAQPLPPTHRQIFFFSKYVHDFVKEMYTPTKKPKVFDSHPLVVVPYTEYWMRKGGEPKERIHELTESLKQILRNLPKVSLLVVLKPRKLSTVVERISYRQRFNSREELDLGYISFINQGIISLAQELGPSLTHEVLMIEAEKEMDRRAREINEYLLNSKPLSSTVVSQPTQESS